MASLSGMKSQKSGDVPCDPPSDCEIDMKVYRARKCKFCLQWSTSRCPWPVDDSVLSAWKGLLPWARGTLQKPVGEHCKLCVIVWQQGGFEAEYGSEAKFFSTLNTMPTEHHCFMAIRNHAIKMKIADPNCKFRLETVGGTIKEEVRTEMSTTTGLKKPSSAFVELTVYEKDFGKAEPEQIIYEIIDGKRIAGCNVLTGRAGYYPRISKEENTVRRSALLTDHNIDPTGEAITRIFNAAKRQVIQPTAPCAAKRPKYAMGDNGSSTFKAKDEPEHDPEHRGESDEQKKDTNEDDEGSEEEEEIVGMMGFLRGRFGGSVSKSSGGSSSAAAKRKAKAKSSAVATGRNRAQQPKKVPIGSAAGNKRKSEDMSNAGIDLSLSGSNAGEMNDTDKALLSEFDTKLQEYKEVKPPLDDAGFKQYMGTCLSNFGSVLKDLKEKRKSVGRRSNKEEDPLYQDLGRLLEKVPEYITLMKCINGAPVATTTTLLDQLDKAVSSEGFTFNSCVYKRGLKIMVLEDIKHSRWCALATTTCSEIERNLKQFNDGEKDNDPAAFQYMMLSQAVQRLIKGASSKLKMKEPLYNVGNKKELSALDALLEEVIKSDAASSTMKHDAQTFFALLRADTMPVPEVRAAIGVLDELMRNKQLESPLHLTATVQSCGNFGVKLAADATSMADVREKHLGEQEELNKAMKEIPKEYQDITSENFETLSLAMHTGASAVTTIIKDKFMSKSMGREALSALKADLQQSGIFMMLHSCVHQVLPWMEASATSIRSTKVFSSPPTDSWAGWKQLASLDQYQVLNSFLKTASNLSSLCIATKAGSKSSDCLSPAVAKLDGAMKKLKDTLSSIVSLEKVKWNNFVDISKEMTSSLSWLCETYCHAGVEDAKGKVLAALEKLIEHGKADDISADAEQLKLHAAALPDSDPLRAQLLASADSATTFVQSGNFQKAYAEVPTSENLLAIATIIKSMQQVMESSGQALSCLFPEGKDFPSEAIESKGNEIVSQIESQLERWGKTQESILAECVATFDAMKLPDPSTISFPEDNTTKCSPPIDAFPDLKALDSKSMANLTKTMQDCFESADEIAKQLDLKQYIPILDTARVTYNKACSILAIIALIRLMSSKRFEKAIKSNEAVPAIIIENINVTMTSCKEHNLTVPGALQALALLHAPPQKPTK